MLQKRSIAIVLLTLLLLIPVGGPAFAQDYTPDSKPVPTEGKEAALSHEAQQYLKLLQYAAAVEAARYQAILRFATIVHYIKLVRFYQAIEAAQHAAQAQNSVWDRLAKCESGGNWGINTGNGYYGGLQFALSSWRGVGGSGYPHLASREVQIEMGKRLQRSQGWGAWPACSRKLGLR